MSQNQLSFEKSPYLLQHAHNPVDWYPWGQAAFDKARLEMKPVLLSIGYSTCHWCHVMAHESFEDREIAKFINEHFIAVKVDREERPDIDHIYMAAVTSMTGQGGWPLTVFLTPQGEPFYGGTYFPPFAKWGSPGFMDVLHSIFAGWNSDRAGILSSGKSIAQGLRSNVKREDSSESMDGAVLSRALRQLSGQYDSENGGFGTAPKFPMGHTISFLLRVYASLKDPDVLSMAEASLTKMAQGGISDHLDGGFHRYSTDARWHVPHFEKMLYDQALLSRAYLEGFQATGSGAHAQKARDILDYCLRRMNDSNGGFYSAQDADSRESLSDQHTKEGAFYVFAQAEIEETLGLDQAIIFNYCYGIEPQGNAAFDPHGEFVGKNILYQARTLQEAAGHFHKPVDEVQLALEEARAKLLARRQLRPHPQTDDKVLCDWNGLMIASFAFAGRVLGEERYTHAAIKAVDFVLTRLLRDHRLLHRWRDGSAGIQATLEDYVFFIYGLLEVYEAVFEDRFLDQARILCDQMIEFFADPAGGFYMTAKDAQHLILRPKEVYDGALPSGNSVAALVLLKLSALTENASYQSRAKALFDYFTPVVSKAPYAHCFLLSALDLYLQGPLEITLQGPRDGAAMDQMLKVLYKYFLPNKIVKYVPGGRKTQVQICFRGSCRLPLESAADFDASLAKMFI